MEQREIYPLPNQERSTPHGKRSFAWCLLLLCMFLGVAAQAQTGRRVTLSFNQEPLATVLKKVGDASGYKINFNTEDVQGFSVTAKVDNKTATEALDIVLKGKPFRYEEAGEFILIQRLRKAGKALPATKQRMITGYVWDEQNVPIPGVSVRIKEEMAQGKMSGNITSADGEYVMPLYTDKKTTLVFSFVGMETLEVSIPAGQQDVTRNIILKEDQTKLDEVVVTGIFNKPRESYTGAATSFTRKELEAAGNQNLATMLRNLDPSFNIMDDISIGSDPNSLPSITVRGASSLPTDVQDMQVSADNQRTANQPLFILDGFEISLTRFMDLDESQVESITLLKDANATAMYGSKGSNGVVVITSKAIEPGKLRFSYKGTLQIEAPDLTSYDLMNAREKLEYEKAAGLYNTESAVLNQSLQDLYNQRKLAVERGVDTYWLKYPVRTGIGQRHNVSVEGGNESLRYGASLSYNNVEGAMKGSDRNTLTGEMFLLYNFKNVTFQNRLTITNNKAHNSPYGSFSDYAKMNAYFTPYDEEGNIQYMLEDQYYYASINRYNTVYNPLYNAYLPQKNESEYTEITNNFAVEWHILPELFFRGQFSVTKQTNRSDVYVSADNTMFEDFTGDDYRRKGRYTYGTGNSLDYYGQATLNYSKTFGGKHQIFGGLGFTIDNTESESYSIVAEGISVLNMDFLGMASQYLKDGRPSGSESITRSIGGVFNFQYTYDNRYYFDLNGKYDGSSQFGSNNHFAPFWSTGAGWNIHNEKFMMNQQLVNIARLRLSYGITGSQNYSSYLSIRTYQDYGGQSTQGWYGAYLMAYGNPDLKWQKTGQLNVGMDLEMFNRRLNVSFDWYNKITNDLLADINLPISSGFSSYKANVGKVQNRGYEISLQAQLIRDVERDFRWTVGVKAAHNENKVKEISNSLQELNDQLSSQDAYNPSFQYREGESMNTIYAVPSKGIDPATGQEIFVKRDGTETFEWDAEDQVPCGVAEPKLQGTINTNVRWKGFSVNLIFGYKFGGQAYNSTLANKVENIYPFDNADRRVLYDRWKQPGDQATFKRVTDFSDTYATSRFVFDDDAFYASSMNIGYEFPTEWLKSHLGISYLALNGYLEDLFYTSTIKRERGTDYPFARNFSLSLTVRF